MRNIKTVAAFLLLIMVLCSTGCSAGNRHRTEDETCKSTEESVHGRNKTHGEETVPEKCPVAETPVREESEYSLPEWMGTTVREISEKYGGGGMGHAAPFYNIGNDAEFAVHFKSTVNPVSAVTVHTDRRCTADSMVYQVNEGYLSDGGTDVVVKPGMPVLGDGNGYGWGSAPVYYLCIRYDTESPEARVLDRPEVIPFTVMHETSTPNVTPEINGNGQFVIRWEAVPDAAEYVIYHTPERAADSPAYGMTKAESGYACETPERIASVDGNTTEFRSFNGTDGLMVSEGGYVAGENAGLSGTYYVTAVNAEGHESAYSLPVEYREYAPCLPYSFDEQTTFDKKNGTATVLPASGTVRMADGSTARFPVSYKKLSEDGKGAVYAYSVEGTLLTGTVRHENPDRKYPPSIDGGASTAPSMYAPDNRTGSIPPCTIRTNGGASYISILDRPADGVRVTFPQESYYARAELESMRAEYDGVYPEGTNPFSMFHTDADTALPMESAGDAGSGCMQHIKNTGYAVFADSPAEEYLALCMIGAERDIRMDCMPELQDVEYLMDAVYKTIYQNPYIIGVESFSYSYDDTTLHVEYSKRPDEIRRQQDEIAQKTREIISMTITEDMDEEERIKAVWDYLDKNASYDDDARNHAEDSGFSDITGHEDSFSAYGTICTGRGVCQSYMHATKLLCAEAGIKCVSITGTMQNALPHGWNAVMIDGNWYWLDTTNGMTNAGVPYFIFLTSEEFAHESWNYTADNGYALDTELGFADSFEMDRDYYVSRGLFAKSHSDITKAIKKEIKAYDGVLYIKCTFIPDINDEDFICGICDALRDAGYAEAEISRTMFGNIGQVMVVDMTGTVLSEQS